MVSRNKEANDYPNQSEIAKILVNFRKTNFVQKKKKDFDDTHRFCQKHLISTKMIR